MKLGYGFLFSLRVVQLVVTSSVTCWRSRVWSTRTTERETSTSFTSWWRAERKISSAGLVWRGTANTTITWCRSVQKALFVNLVQQKSSKMYFIFCLLQGDCAKVSSINDKSDWKMVRKALSVIEFNESDIEVRYTLKRDKPFI